MIVAVHFAAKKPFNTGGTSAVIESLNVRARFRSRASPFCLPDDHPQLRPSTYRHLRLLRHPTLYCERYTYGGEVDCSSSGAGVYAMIRYVCHEPPSSKRYRGIESCYRQYAPRRERLPNPLSQQYSGMSGASSKGRTTQVRAPLIWL